MGLGERCNVHEVVRVRLLEDMTSEQSPEGGGAMWESGVEGRVFQPKGIPLGKDPEVGSQLECSENSQEAMVAGTE